MDMLWLHDHTWKYYGEILTIVITYSEALFLKFIETGVIMPITSQLLPDPERNCCRKSLEVRIFFLAERIFFEKKWTFNSYFEAVAVGNI